MENRLLSDGGVRIVLTPQENRIVYLSLLEALTGLARDSPKFRTLVGVSADEARSLMDSLGLINKRLYAPPQHSLEKDWHSPPEYVRIEPRRSTTARENLPTVEAELLPDARVSYTLTRKEVAIFAGAVDAMLHELAPRKSRGTRTAIKLRVGGAQIEEAEQLREELRRVDQKVQGEPKLLQTPTELKEERQEKPWPSASPMQKEGGRKEVRLMPDGRARIIVSKSDLKLFDFVLAMAEWTPDWDYLENPLGPAGLRFEEVRMLGEEFSKLRSALRGGPASFKLRDGRIIPTVPEETGTAWEGLPVVEGEPFPDGRAALVLPLKKLAVLPDLFEYALLEHSRSHAAPDRLEPEGQKSRWHFRDHVREAEALRDELWRAARELRV